MKTTRVIALTLCLFFITVSLRANLIKNSPTKYIQPDGTVLDLLVSGDEYFNRLHDDKGYTILRHPENGYAVYAVADGNSIKASDFIVGKTNPVTLGIKPNLIKQDQEAERRFQEQRYYTSLRDHISPVGVINNIVVFVRFADQSEFPDTTTYTWYNNLFNSPLQRSMWDYYDEVSSGQLDINTYLYSANGFNVVSLQVVHNRGYYNPYHSMLNPDGYTNGTEAGIREVELITELLEYSDPLIPNDINIDINSDNDIDALTFIFRGPFNDNSFVLWPAHVSSSRSFGTINGVPVKHYVKNFEGGIGSTVICHEMGHMIGFPDMYRYEPNPSGVDPVGLWSLMSYGFTPLHELVYEKWRYGNWFESIPTLTPTSTPTQYTLTAVDQNPYAAYKILSNYPNQYYIVEYRRQEGRYESELPGSGLLVYRVIDDFLGEDVNGNAQGPPDEVYIYRPGGDLDTNGDLLAANFSSNVGRTAIHNGTDPDPWIFRGTAAWSQGNLIITDIGTSGGTTIHFTLWDYTSTNFWDGSYNSDWGIAYNWSLNTVPSASQNVVILSGVPNNPVTNSDYECLNLTLNPSASLTITAGTLRVGNNFTSYGSLMMTVLSGNLIIGQDLYFDNGSTVTMTSNAEIYVTRHIEFRPGSNIEMDNGTIITQGSTQTNIRIFDMARIFNLSCQKSSISTNTNFSSASDHNLTIRGNLIVNATSRLVNGYTGTIYLKGNLNVLPGGQCHITNGSLNLISSTEAILNLGDSGNYLNHLQINKTAGYNITLGNNLNLHGDLTIQSGTLKAFNEEFEYNITISGNWTNNVGSDGFLETPGKVVFNGLTNQTISSEHFDWLENNKADGSLVFLSESVVSCDHYDWTAGNVSVMGGSFIVGDLGDSGIYGSIFLDSGLIEYHQDTVSLTTVYGDIVILDGTFNVYGGLAGSVSSFESNTTLIMSDGVLDFKNAGIQISSNSVLVSIVGGTIRTAGDFSVLSSNFNPTGGTIELYGGSGACDLRCYASSYMHNLLINKNPGIIVNIMSYLELKGDLTIQSGVLKLFNSEEDYDILIAGNWINKVGTAGFIETGGTVTFNGTANQTVSTEQFDFLGLNKNGGALIIPTGSVVSCNHYDWTVGTITIDGGTFTANDMVDTAILGTFNLNLGYVYLHQDTAHSLNLKGTLNISGGELHIFGMINDTRWPNGGSAFLNMSNGLIDVHDKGISIVRDTLFFATNITGGTIRCAGNFYNDRPDFHPAGGILEMYSPISASMMMTAGRLNTLVLNKSDGILTIPNGSVVLCNGYSWLAGTMTVSGGTFTAFDMLDEAIRGTVNLSSGEINFYQDSTQWLNLNGALNISSGELNIYGMCAESFWPYWGDASLTMSGGVIDLHDNGLFIYPVWNFPTNITGGTIRSAGGFLCGRADFNPTGGVVEMYAGNDVYLYMRAGSLYNLVINKSDTLGVQTPSVSVLESSPYIYGTLTIADGILNLNGCSLTVEGNAQVYGKLELDGASILKLAAGSSLTVFNGGILETLGNETLAATISRNGTTGYYGLNIESGGMLSAGYTVFEYMNSNGIYLKNGSYVKTDNSLHNCTFRNGAAGGTLLKIDNNQDFTLNSAVFPANIWGGTYNVSKTLNQGRIEFINAVGDFCGNNFEQDAYNRITWSVIDLPPVESLVMNYNTLTDVIGLSWTYPITVNHFHIYRSTDPSGEFIEYSSSKSTFWSEPVTGDKCFYYVTAVVE